VWLILVLNSSSYRAAHPGMAIVGTLGTLWTIFWVQFAVITLIFATLERFQSREKFIEQWKPSQLPRVRRNPDRVSRAESAFGLVFGVVFLSWLAGLPALPGLALGPAANYLMFAPALHAYYLPIVLITLAGMAQQGLNLARPDWTWLPPVIRLITGAASLLVVNSLLKVYPYVELVDPAANWKRYGLLIGVLNTTIQISVAVCGLGFAIACCFYAFQCIVHFRRRMARPADGAPGLPGTVAEVPKGRG
jgi:hypothetical protein